MRRERIRVIEKQATAARLNVECEAGLIAAGGQGDHRGEQHRVIALRSTRLGTNACRTPDAGEVELVVRARTGRRSERPDTEDDQ